MFSGENMADRRLSMAHTIDLHKLAKTCGMPLPKLSEWHRQFNRIYTDDRIPKEKFVELYGERFGRNGCSTDFYERIFNAIDDDRNGYIEFDELAMFIGRALKGSQTDKLRWTFKILDLDSSKEIDLKELEQILLVSTSRPFYTK